MDILQENKDSGKTNFLKHVFSTTDEHKAEFFNGFQYAILGVVPVIVLNKLIQKFIPEADTEKSSLETLVEVFIQILVMIGGVIIIHRVITFVPTYSGFKYDNLAITNVILLFLVVILSIQTKIGIKISILVDRLNDLWSGEINGERKATVKKRSNFGGEITSVGTHVSSQADHIDSGASSGFPPMPMVQSRGASPPSVSAAHDDFGSSGPLPANALLGSSFNSF